jgi:glycosyltransferase involved in cell wall biosynthesis
MVKQDSKKILLLTIGNVDHPSSRIRGIQYIPLLEKEGYEVEWIPRIPVKGKGFLHALLFPFKKRIHGFNRFLKLYFAKNQIVFIQKLFISKAVFKRLSTRNNHIIFDFDDAIFINPKDANAELKTQKQIHLANHVIVANEHLAAYVKKYNKNVSVITTPVDTDVLKPLKDKKLQTPYIIGWIGSFWTTKYLKIIEEALRKVHQKYPIKLMLIGADKKYQPVGFPVEHVSWSLENEKNLLPTFDMGIMPLEDDAYAKGKGGYKLLQYMAAGIPAIASPIGINKEIIQENKTGFLAKNEEAWVKHIINLIEHPKKIITFGQISREICIETYSRQVCFKKLIETLN